MSPLPDRVVIVGLVATIGLCFALVFWTVRLQPGEPPLRWRDGATALQSEPMPVMAPASASLSL